MDEQRQDDQLEPTYSSSVPIGRGGERGSGISVLKVQHDNEFDKIFRNGNQFSCQIS